MVNIGMYLSKLFQYEKLVRVLLDILGGPGQEEFVERITIYLLNSLGNWYNQQL